MGSVKAFWKKTRRFFYKHVLHADDSPNRIALGAAVAMLVAFSPTVGFQTVIAIALATVLRANKAVCIPIVWITNPVTIVPIYGACWELGRALTNMPQTANGGNVALALAELSGHANEGIWARLFETEFWSRLLHIMFEFGFELWVGCLAVGAVAAFMTFFAARWGVTEYRQRRRVRRIYRNIRRARIRKARSRGGRRGNLSASTEGR